MKFDDAGNEKLVLGDGQRFGWEGSGGGSVGRAVASDARDPRFES